MSAKPTKTQIKAIEARIVKAALARYREWLKIYPEGLRPIHEGGVTSRAGRALIRATAALAKARGES